MKKIISVVVVATLFAMGTATAQEPAASGALNECYESTGDQPRTALQPCLERKADEATSQMTTAYNKLQAQTKEIDSSATAQALASLRASQEAFEAFKDAQCQWQADAAMGGSGAGDFSSACKVDLIRWRAQQLSD
ncbi:UmoC family flagellar biogenesis regulator [Pseudomonas sp. UM16]|uniref:UmoC family flagellar biogenesis regulator n=1 Tax=Pseudomonas sp. UM16 TaxID=3158962 RepID=UPI00398FFE72